MKNTGKQSEQLFDDHFKRLGKRAFVHKFIDAAMLYGMNSKRIVNLPPAPSDRLVTCDGLTFYAEVKSTVDPNSFRFKLLRKVQSGIGTMVLRAGGEYFVFIHAIALGKWFRVPYAMIEQWEENTSSTPWSSLSNFEWKCNE